MKLLVPALAVLLTATAVTGAAVDPRPLPPPLPPALPVVPGLNADFLDDKDASDFLGVRAKAADSDLLDGRDSTDFANAVHDHDDRYYTEAESDARFLGIGAKAADSDRLDGLDSSQLLRSDTSGRVAGTLVVERLGINRASPDATLHMVGGGPTLRMDNSDTGGGAWWLRHNGGSSQFVIGNTPDLGDGNIKLRLNEQGDLAVTGHLFAHGNNHAGDVAEPVVGAGLVAGEVVVSDGFDPSGKLRGRAADQPFSRAVIGVVSTSPSVVLAGLPTDTPLAIAGIVPVKVIGPVAKDDLLTSSGVRGHAMACLDPAVCSHGVTIGKALEAHSGAGPGVVRVLVSVA